MKKEDSKCITEERLITHFRQETEGAERAEIEAWLADSEEHRKVYRQVCRVVLWSRWSRKEQLIDEEGAFGRLRRGRPRPFLRRWRYVAAVAVLAVVFAGGWLWKLENERVMPEMAEVSPGSPKARLILSTGEKIDLTRKNKPLKEQNGSVVEWDSAGKIRYQSAPQGGQQHMIHNRIEVPRGGEFQIILGDGTRIWLNADTELEYPVEFARDIREVQLRGEAYFEVTKDAERPFVVRVGEYRLEVYGTEFNLNAYDSTRLEAVLVKGSVGFKATPEGPTVMLKPDQLGIANPETGATEVFDVESYPYIAWKNNDMVFVNERLESIMQKVERWYDVEVVFGKAELKELRFYGDVKRYADIRELLAYLEQTSRARFKVEGRTIVITER